MSAAIDHGDSGGPVVNRRGQVIGINVGMAAEQGKLTLAIPIDVAKEFLESAGVTPDVGPLTQTWIEGLALFHRGAYDDASRKFVQVWESQGETRAEKGSLLLFGAADPLQNPYVLLMLQRSQDQSGE